MSIYRKTAAIAVAAALSTGVLGGAAAIAQEGDGATGDDTGVVEDGTEDTDGTGVEDDELLDDAEAADAEEGAGATAG